MKTAIAILTIFGVFVAVTARAQVEPEATSPGKIAIKGTLTYSARYGQVFEHYNGNFGEMANLSGRFGYTTTSQRHPTSIDLGAGDSWRLSGIGYSSGPYESLAISQAAHGQHWMLDLSDSLSYRSGVGVSEFTPSSANSVAEPIATLDTATLNNDSVARLSNRLNGSTTLSAGANYNLLTYPNGNGIDTNRLSANFGMNHRLEARDTIFAEYAFSQFNYSTRDITIDANTATAGWQRSWTRRIYTSISVGPEWVSFQASTPVPSFTGYSASASISHISKFSSEAAVFTHGVDGGGGYLYGAQVNGVTGNYTRRFGRNVRQQWEIGLVGGYRVTNSLNSLQSIPLPNGFGTQADYTTKYGSTQASKHLGRLFSAYANYMAMDQSANHQVTGGLLNGLWQTATVGIGFTPPEIHLRQ